ncbi:MAG: sulfatase-like hydrolase/transferase, partial [Planctomycetes bacterium]|nr:sulfatase-like hydrolase/transferase [Planctomycetota bacterium]
ALDLEAEDYAAAPFPTIASALKEEGYRTGLFHSGLFDYLGMRAVLAERGFDALEDARSLLGGERTSFGADDRAMVARLLEWLDAAPAAEPCLSVFLPIAGHHPYGAPVAGPFPVREEFDEYRNALHFADGVVGALLDGLAARGRLERTLIAITGDHGEAFEQHPGNVGHVFYLYEENVRVPLLIAAPGIEGFARRVRGCASHVDLAPTLLDLLGIAAPPGFEGRTLLGPEPRLALFAADYSLALVGLRDGDWKFIGDPGGDHGELYDLAADPRETTNLSLRDSDHAARAALYRDHLAAWARAQHDAWLRPAGGVDGAVRRSAGAPAE